MNKNITKTSKNTSYSILKLLAVKKSFQKEKLSITVIDNISTRLFAGSKTIVTGASGSGKTTLLSIIAGLDIIDSGKIIINNTEISSLNEKKKAAFRLKHIGFIFQYHYLLSDLTALENVMLPLLMLGEKKDIATNIANEMLYKIGIKHRANHYPAQLSGGECQRTSIARALITNPTLVLADEPTGALDSKNSTMIRDILSELVSFQNTTLIVATHDQDFLSIADIHCHMFDGKLKGRILNKKFIL